MKKRFFQPEFLYEFQVSTWRDPAGGGNENRKDRKGSWGRDGRRDKGEGTGVREGWNDEERTGEGLNRENQTGRRKTQVIFLDRWKLSVMEQGRLGHMKEEITFSLYLNDVESTTSVSFVSAQCLH